MKTLDKFKYIIDLLFKVVNREELKDYDFTQEEAYNFSSYSKDVRNSLKALEIIIKRKIDVTDIMDTTDDYELYKAYCKGKSYADEYICTKKEFNLLKEVLNND